MNYTKPEVIAKNQPTGTFAAGCPANGSRNPVSCNSCDRTQ